MKVPKVIEINIKLPNQELDEGAVHQQIIYAVEDYIQDKAQKPDLWKVKVNGVMWNE